MVWNGAPKKQLQISSISYIQTRLVDRFGFSPSDLIFAVAPCPCAEVVSHGTEKPPKHGMLTSLIKESVRFQLNEDAWVACSTSM